VRSAGGRRSEEQIEKAALLHFLPQWGPPETAERGREAEVARCQAD
jgi:hypothetical protein